MVLFFRHIPFVVNHTFNATPPERFQQVTLALNPYLSLTPHPKPRVHRLKLGCMYP